MWVAVDSEKTLVRVNARTRHIAATVSVSGGTCGNVDASHRPAVWVTSRICGAMVSRIDPGTNQVTITRDQPETLLGVAGDAGSVWVAERTGAATGTLLRLDPVTLEVKGALQLDTAITGVTQGMGSGSPAPTN